MRSCKQAECDTDNTKIWLNLCTQGQLPSAVHFQTFMKEFCLADELYPFYHDKQ